MFTLNANIYAKNAEDVSIALAEIAKRIEDGICQWIDEDEKDNYTFCLTEHL